jgi:uncharacterized protein DUF6982
MSPHNRKVVARYRDGKLVKGYTFDFLPSQPRFHVFAEPNANGASAQVFLRDLKALFFVRDLVGDPGRRDGQSFPAGDSAGAHVEVRFLDGEVMAGTIEGAATDTPGFFLVPADEGSNNLRVYVLAAATRAVYPIPALARSAARAPAGQSVRPRTVPSLLPGRLLSWLTR